MSMSASDDLPHVQIINGWSGSASRDDGQELAGAKKHWRIGGYLSNNDVSCDTVYRVIPYDVPF